MLEGAVVKCVRPMTQSEVDHHNWTMQAMVGSVPLVLVLEKDGNEIRLFASRDPEGNGPGVIFGEDPDGSFLLSVRGAT